MKSLIAEKQNEIMQRMKKEKDEEKKIKIFNEYSDLKHEEEEKIAKEHGLSSLIEVQKERNKLRKFTFVLPDELADKMKREFMKAKKKADARAEQERIEKERLDKYQQSQNAEKIKPRDFSSCRALERK